jgi:AcrR family transcriptional regulator
MRLFEEQGFDRVNVGALAKAAEVSVPTFYAHFPSKEHVVMQLPTAEQMAALMATQPADLPLATRLRRAAPVFIGAWDDQMRTENLARWKVIASTPALRNRAAAFERETAGLVADALPEAGGSLSPADAVVVNAHLAAYTSALLAWADSDGKDDLVTLVDDAFAALQGGGAT